MALLGLSPSLPVAAEDVRHLQDRAHPGLLRRQFLQGADDFAQDLGGHLGIKRRGFQLFVPEHDLDHADIDFLFQQMGGETVPERMHRDALLDIRCVRRGVNSPVKLAGAQRLERVQAGKQPAAPARHLALGTGHPPPHPQAFEQHRGKDGIAVFLAFAPLDPQGHALAVNVADFQAGDLAGPKPGAIGHGQRRLPFQVAGRDDQA